MRKILSIFCFSVSCLSLMACSSSNKKAEKATPAGYVSKSSGSFRLQPFKEVQLENGLKVVFIRDMSLPRVSLTLFVKTGVLQEPTEHAGLNALTAYLLEQGTQSRDALKIADEFGQLGSSLDVSPGLDTTTLYADSLSTGADELLTLFSDVAMNPAFKDGEMGRIRSQMMASLRKKIDNPSGFADMKMDQYLFGDHPYSREVNGTPETLRKISKQNIIRHYLTFYRPNNSSLAVVGNFGDDYESKVQEVFAKWTRRTIPVVTTTAAPAIEGLKVKLVVKKGLQQTQIRIASLGVTRADENFLKLRVGNEILGGGFASRLNQKVRDDLGLTYSISSYFDSRKEKGSFGISTFTKNETAGKALDEALQVMTSYLDTGATEQEIQASRNQLIGQFPRAIETADRLAFNLLSLDFYGISYDYLTNYNRNINAIGVKDANTAMKQVLNAQQLKVLVYGDESIISQFQKFNPEIERLK